MASVLVAARRIVWVVGLGAFAGVGVAWWRDRDDESAAGPAVWPPLAPDTLTPGGSAPRTNISAATPADLMPVPSTTAGTSSVVNALVDSPEARSASGDGGWVEPAADGSCPIGHPIKANDNSGIFHVPDGRFYERTNAERCYSTPEAAAADGYRRAKH